MPLTIKRTNSTSIAANSVLFNGSNQYLSVGAASNWAFLNNGLTPFTIEAWVNPTSVSTTLNPMIVSTTGYQAQIGFYFQIGNYNNGDVLFSICDGRSKINQWATSNNFLTANTWTHVAVSFTPNGTNVPSATVKFFVNGVLATSSNVLTNTTTYSTSNPTNTLLVGAFQTPLSGYFPGKISNLRILNGTALYTSNFTPPTAPLTAIANTALLTCNSATIVDNSTNNFAITNNGTATVSSLSPTFPVPSNNFQFARRASTAVGNSVLFNGSTQYLSVPDDAALNFGSSNFTIECWVNLSNYTFAQSLFTKRPSASAINTEIQWYINTDKLNLYASSNGTSWIINDASTSAGSFMMNSWNHVALVRNGTEFAGYINGTKSVFGSSAAALFTNTSAVAIGSDQASSIRSAVNGYISNLRIVNGTAVYTASFTPTTTPLTAIANTALLTCNAATIVDSSTNNFTITNNNSATVSSISPFVASGGGMSLKKVFSDPIFGTQKAIFGYGDNGSGPTNLVSNTGVVSTDTTRVGTLRQGLAAAGYGSDKAIFGYGSNGAGTEYSITNLVSNTGVVATDTTGVGTARTGLAAAGYGSDKAIFGYGDNSGDLSMTNLVSNTGVVSTDTTGVGTARTGLAAAGYGSDKAIFGYGDVGNGRRSITNLVSNTGVVATDTTGVGTARNFLAAAGYGTDKAIFGYGSNAGNSYTNITNLVSNTGVVATDTAGVGTSRHSLAAAGYGSDKVIFGYGGTGSVMSMTNLVNNTGVVATDTTGVGTARRYVAAAGYSLT
jgi:hypothetical protein